MPGAEYITDDLAFAAMLLAFGAKLEAIEWNPHRSKCDIKLNADGVDVKAFRAKVDVFFVDLEALDNPSPDRLDIACKGSPLHTVLTWYIDLKRAVLKEARKHSTRK
jgi:hypothetical protein